jgi:hypothetical protein
MAEPDLSRSNLVAALKRFSEKYKDDPNLFEQATRERSPENTQGQIPVNSIHPQDF